MIDASTNDVVRLYRQEPCVDFDVQLGKYVPSGQVLDFDVDAFRRLAIADGTPGSAEVAKIHITPPPSGIARIFGTGGCYTPYDQAISVSFSGNAQMSNHYLRHESKHYFDHCSGNLPSRKFTIAANIGLAASKIATTGLVVGLTHNWLFQDHMPDWEAKTTVAFMGVTALGLASYYLKPDEVRARWFSFRHINIKPLQLLPANEQNRQ